MALQSIRPTNLLVCSLVLGCAGSPSTEQAVGATVDNVILITVDTLRADALGFAGNSLVETPVIDRMAAAGRVFQYAHAHTVTTLPSHASILTGLYPFDHGARHNAGYRLDSEVTTLAERLRDDASFVTAAFVAAFPLTSRTGLDRGFDLYDDELDEAHRDPIGALTQETERSGKVVVDRARSWWREQDGQRRFAWLHLFEPHAPYLPPPPLREQFADHPYLGEVSAVDRYLEPLLRPFLDGNEASTLIVLTSDHGESLGEHGEQTHGLFAYEATLRVPLVVWGGPVVTGVDQRVARHIDLMPTILAATGLEAIADLPGRSLLDPAEGHPRTSLFEALSGRVDYGWAPLRGMIRDRMKFIDLPVSELYDLEHDQQEATNLISEELDLGNGWFEQLPPDLGRLPDNANGPMALTAEDSARLRSLGYLSGPVTDAASFGEADDPKRLLHLDRLLTRMLELAGQGELEAAAAVGREILAERETMGVVYIYLTSILLELGEFEQAIALIDTADSLGLAGHELLGQLGLTLISTGRADSAISVLEPLVEDSRAAGRFDQAADHLALAYTRVGRFSEAEALLLEVFAQGSPRARTAENLALLSLAMERHQEARQWSERAIELEPRRVTSWNNLGVSLYHLDQKPEAISAWRQSLTLAPDDVDTLFNLGIVEAELGRTSAARQTLERFLERVQDDDPRRGQALQLTSQLDRQRGS